MIFSVRIAWVQTLIQDLVCFILCFCSFLILAFCFETRGVRSTQPFQKLPSSFPGYFHLPQPYTNRDVRKSEAICEPALNLDAVFTVVSVGFSLEAHAVLGGHVSVMGIVRVGSQWPWCEAAHSIAATLCSPGVCPGAGGDRSAGVPSPVPGSGGACLPSIRFPAGVGLMGDQGGFCFSLYGRGEDPRQQ